MISMVATITTDDPVEYAQLISVFEAEPGITITLEDEPNLTFTFEREYAGE